MLRRAIGWSVAVGAMVGCGARDVTSQGTDPAQGTASTGAPTTASSVFDPCAPTDAQGVWGSDFVSQQYGESQNFGFFAYPSEPSHRPIDAVFGLSNGPASAFSDLGPIVRFNPAGTIDARDGGAYRADTVVPYVTDGQTQYLFELDLDYATQTYTATVFVGSSNEITIGTGYKFRTEQAGMTRADSFGREVDSPTGSVRMCDPGGSLNWHGATAGSGWVTTPMRAESGVIHVDVEAEIQSSPIDAVIGLASGTPTTFTDLAAIARFSPAGIVDARDGGEYRAETPFNYSGYGFYQLVFDVNIPAGTYSLTVRNENGGTDTVIARDYAFRSEQAGVTSLAALGEFVDGTSGTVYTDRLVEAY